MTLQEKLDFYTNKTDTCWLWWGSKVDGYGRMRVGNKKILAHRLAYQLNCGDIGTMLVLHKCDTPACVNPEHLFLGTDKDNAQDKANKGRSLSGERSPRAKLTADNVIKIYTDSRTYRVIAQEFDTDSATVSRIKNHQAWTIVTQHGKVET